MPNCQLCGEPMPPGEEVFNYHGYSGPCPKPPLPKPAAVTREDRIVMGEPTRVIAGSFAGAIVVPHFVNTAGNLDCRFFLDFGPHRKGEIVVLDRSQVERRMASIEGKYGVITAEKKQFHPGEPVFLLRATDVLAPAAIWQYLLICQEAGCSTEHCEAILRHHDRIVQWQRDNPALVKKRPD